jgi:hypothetical protein
MIISHKHRYIFFPVPKTGTHSIRQALRENMGGEDLEQVGLLIQKRFPFPEFANIAHGHISAEEIRPVLGDETFGSYLKFAFVRNPFDRFVSYCAFTSRNTNYFEVSPLEYMKYIIRELRPVGHMLYLPQHSFLVDSEGKLAMDRIGTPTRPLDKVNTSQHRPYQEYFDRDLIGWVSELYQKDLEMFDYRFD